MGIDVVRTLQKNAWRSFVDEQSEGNIFHTPEMFNVFSRTHGFNPELWAATEDGRILALLLPVRIRLMNGVLSRFTTRCVVYGSVLCSPCDEGREALSRLLLTYVREVRPRPLFTELRNVSNLQPIQPVFRDCGFCYEDHLNYLIDLERSQEEIFQNIGRRTRKNIRRGLRQGEVVIEEVKDGQQVAECYDLIRRTYRAARVPVADQSILDAAFEVLYPKGMVRFTLARMGETPAATSVELLYRGVMYGWFGGMDRAYTSYVPNELLTWHILKWGATNGQKLYDFGGAGKPDEDYGVRDFKAKFGGKLVCYGRNTYVHSPRSLWLSKKGYRFLRRWL
jgi:serine/alanine adding enzyme